MSETLSKGQSGRDKLRLVLTLSLAGYDYQENKGITEGYLVVSKRMTDVQAVEVWKAARDAAAAKVTEFDKENGEPTVSHVLRKVEGGDE